MSVLDQEKNAPRETPSPPGSILSRTAVGAGWMFAWRMATRILGLMSTLILVRLLNPEDFGLFALAYAFIATLEAAVMIGLEQQIIRARHTSTELYDTVFTMNAIRGGLLCLLVLIIAEPSAAFFKEERLKEIILALAMIPLLAGFSNVGAVEFTRNLDFLMVFKLLIVPRILQIVVTLLLAFLLRDHWALVCGSVAGQLFSTFSSYVFHPYRPRLSLNLWRDLIGISAWTWAFNVLTAIRDRTEVFIIGRLLGPRVLGVYTISVEISALPTTELANPISQAAMPGFASSFRSQDPRETASAFLRVLGLTVLVSLPAAFGISLIAGPTVILALGSEWRDAVPLIAILGGGYAVLPIIMVCNAILNAKAYLRQMVMFVATGVIVRTVIIISVIYAGYGLHYIAWGIITSLLVDMILVLTYCSVLLRVQGRELAGVVWRPLAAVAIMIGVMWGSGLGWSGTPETVHAAAINASKAVISGALSYLGSLGLMWVVCRKPAGAEADMLAFLGGMGAKILPKGLIWQKRQRLPK